MKKKLFSAPSILLAAALFTASCGGNTGKGGNASDSITFDSIKVDSTLSLTEDTAGPRCHVSLCLTYAKGKNADMINDSIIRSGILSPDYFSITSEKISPEMAVDSFVKRYLAEYRQDYGEIYRAVGGGASFNCDYIVKTYVIDDNDKYFTYIANVYSYGGGAHGNSVVIARNIDISTGKIVSLKDLFVPGFDGELNDLIVKALCDKYEVNGIEGLHEKTIFSGIDVYAPAERNVYYNTAAESHFKIGEYDKAIPFYEKQILVCRKEEKADALYRIGFCHMFLEEWGKAAETFMSAAACYRAFPTSVSMGRLKQLNNMIKGCLQKAANQRAFHGFS